MNPTYNIGINMEVAMKNLVVTEEVWKEGNMYTAYCPELDVVSCGRNIEEARKNLLEVIEIHLEEVTKLGALSLSASPNVLVAEITQNLETALAQFQSIQNELDNNE